ncbi:(S)-benzoin forming benzil reductase [Paenibacillus sp. FSL R7-0337]|uniref:(S)-benzoin forming benzil reductase n=1 Tax=Paenibacillus sp. FSL R7-0337 TaxID=1926588 RepID=UPI00096C8820|nr:(S)-benzoin forming benzil reductase [Paenibacillus sp. FSL R7-0337]OMG00917.1 short-chain dehydrogenase [Paenibacillus sp. FSL R7-0337]
MKHIIITGTSRGIGESLANQLINPAHHLICISRTANEGLLARAKELDCHLDYFNYDLTDISGIEQLVENVFSRIELRSSDETIYLINNAAMLTPVSPIERLETEQIVENLHLNLLAPMVITSNFLRLTKHMNADKKILNISSASAKYILPSQSAYSTAKAGLDSFTKCIDIEQKLATYPAKAAAVYPGMIDTSLQSEIRSVSTELFPYVNEFIQLSEEGKLQSPEYTASKLIEILVSEDFGKTVLIETID